MSTLAAAEASTGTRFRSEDYLAGILQRLATQRKDALVRLPGQWDVVVFGSKGLYTAGARAADAFFRLPSTAYRVLPIDEDTRQSAERVARPLGELLWRAAFHASAGRLMEGCSHLDVASLARWPNLTRVPITPNTMRICALLARRPTTLSLASRLLKVDAAEMNQFYSAATCAGSVEVVTRKGAAADREPTPAEPEAQPVAQPPQRRRLLSLLFAKLVGA
jgi:hypothetical protein